LPQHAVEQLFKVQVTVAASPPPSEALPPSPDASGPPPSETVPPPSPGGAASVDASKPESVPVAPPSCDASPSVVPSREASPLLAPLLLAPLLLAPLLPLLAPPLLAPLLLAPLLLAPLLEVVLSGEPSVPPSSGRGASPFVSELHATRQPAPPHATNANAIRVFRFIGTHPG
jgi:hypothetical protein